jgi:hypothetical protein
MDVMIVEYKTLALYVRHVESGDWSATGHIIIPPDYTANQPGIKRPLFLPTLIHGPSPINHFSNSPM